MIVFGLGTGRCGTLSFVNMMKALKKSTLVNGDVTMHRLGSDVEWSRSYNPPQPVEGLLFDIYTAEMKDRSHIHGDVAPYHLPYAKYYRDYFHDVEMRFVVFKRDREETIESYMHWRPDSNFWADHDGSMWKHHNWDKCYPSYDPSFSKREAIGIWYDEYYAVCESNALSDPDWEVFPMEAFNDVQGLAPILKFIGVSPSNCFMLNQIDFNSDPAHKADYTNQPIDKR